jgi:hypothetical protein
MIFRVRGRDVRPLAGKPRSIPVPAVLSSSPPSKRQTAQHGIADGQGANRSTHGAPDSPDNEEAQNNPQCEDHGGNRRTRFRIHHYRHQGHECQRSQHTSTDRMLLLRSSDKLGCALLMGHGFVSMTWTVRLGCDTFGVPSSGGGTGPPRMSRAAGPLTSNPVPKHSCRNKGLHRQLAMPPTRLHGDERLLPQRSLQLFCHSALLSASCSIMPLTSVTTA